MASTRYAYYCPQLKNELFFKLILVVPVKNEKPIKASLALDWLRCLPEYDSSSAAQCCKEHQNTQ
ncbi:hypothetical protein [Snodgrassella communis]|uniref:hypothetical protein n=1 Tax=Snodgrassella communis TaxID=2946699 RepID=UPI001EF6954C|nr:hypothetical protein [Snodgrassella communis]